MNAKPNRWSRKSTLLVVGLCVVALAGAAAVWYFNRDTTPEDVVPAGAANLCDNWKESEYESSQKESKRDFKGDSSVIASVVVDASYQAIRCSSWLGELDTFTGSAIAALAHQTDSDKTLDPDNNDLATALEKYLTAEGLVSMWSTTSRGDDAVPPSNYVSMKKMKSAQNLIGIGLAQASDTSLEKSLSPDYVKSLQGLGTKKIQLRTYYGALDGWSGRWEVQAKGPVVYGWTVLAPLLRFGEYDESFLTPVATAILDFDREHDGDWTVKGEKPASFDMYALDADDAMDAVLEALSRNKEAAKQVAEATDDDRVAKLID